MAFIPLKSQLQGFLDSLRGRGKNQRGSRDTAHVVTHQDFQVLTNLFMEAMPDPDEVLKAAGLTAQAYRVTLVDSHVAGALAQRKSRTKLSELKWEPGKNPDGTIPREAEAALETVRRQFDGIAGNRGIRPVINEILDAPFFGMQPLELFWNKLPTAADRPDGEVVLENILGKPFEWFAYDKKGNLKIKKQLTTTLTQLRPIPPNRYINVVNDGTYANPYGDRAVKRVYWPYLFKKGGFRFWSEFLEKYGMPFIWGHLDTKKSSMDFDTFYEKLVAMVRNGVIVTQDESPDGNRIEVVEAKGRASSSDAYKGFKNAMNIEISKAILGETLTIENSETGSQAATKIHEDQLRDLQDMDKGLSEETFNKISRLITDLNHGKDVPAPTAWLINEREQEERDNKIVERDSKLTEKLGVKFTKEYVRKTYSLDEKDFELGSPAPKTPAPGQTPGQGGSSNAPDAGGQGDEEAKGKSRQQFLEYQEEGQAIRMPVQEALDKYLRERLTATHGITDPAADKIAEIVKTSRNFNELFERMAAMRDEINNAKFGEVFTEILTVHELAGEDAAIRNVL